MIRAFLVMVVLFSGLLGFPQTVADSLRKLLNEKADTTQVNLLNELSWELCGADNQAALKYAWKSAAESHKLGFKKGLAVSNNYLGVIYQNMGAYDSSVYYLEKALQAFKSLNLGNNAAGCLNNLGITYIYQSRFDKALTVLYQALETKNRHNDRDGLSSVYNNIGIVYANLGNYDKALWYYLKSIKAADQKTSRQALANTLNNVGLIYQSKKLYDSANRYFKRSLNTCEMTGNKNGIAAALSNLGSVYMEQGKTRNALEYYLKSLAINEQINNLFAIASIYNNLGWLYQQKKEYQRSIDYYHKARLLSGQIGSKIQEVSSLEGISKNYESMGNFALSLKYYKEFKKAQDSVFSTEKEKTIAGLREKFEAGQREQLIGQLNAEAELREYRLNSQKNWLMVSIFGTILISLFSVIMLIQRNQKHRAYRDLLLKNIENARIERQAAPVILDAPGDITDDPDGMKTIENDIIPEKYKSSAMNSFQKEIIYNRIQYAMTVDKLFLRPDLTIEKLAAGIKTNKSYISQVINESENQNFSSFLNDHRIREARRLILDAGNKNLTIEAIARMVGFNSKSAFNNAFKKFTGLTPSFFLKNTIPRIDNEPGEPQES